MASIKNLKKEINNVLGDIIDECLFVFPKDVKKSEAIIDEIIVLFDELIENITQWADDKGILVPDNAPKQSMKIMEELGETMGAILKGKKTDEVIDGIGDILVTVIILSKQLGLNPTECLESAWNEIKDRKGKTVNGTFIKEEEL